MFKFINKKRIKVAFAAFICLLAAVGASVAPAFAFRPSGDYHSGSTFTGIYKRDGASAVNVKNLKIKYDISGLPNLTYNDELNYRATVTAEYTLLNNTDETISADLLIPEQDSPDYFSLNYTAQPIVKVGGEEVQLGVRHADATFRDGRDAIRISDERDSDGFFTPDLPVHEYKVRTENDVYSTLKGDLITDFTKARYISDGYGEFKCECSSDGENVFYILGDESAVDFSKLRLYAYMNSYDEVALNDGYTVEKVGTQTLSEFAKRFNRAADGIGELDFYNGMVAKFSNNQCVCSISDLGVNRLEKYYIYTVEIAPQSELVTSVTLPACPEVSSGNDYRYYFNADSISSWDGFGKLEVEVVTNYYISGYTMNFVKTTTGYKAEYSAPPQGYIYFSLYENANDNPNEYVSDGETVIYTAFGALVFVVLIRIAIFIVGGGIAFIVLMVAKSRKK